MEFHLGADVISIDGKKVGTVDSVVVDYNTKEVEKILVKQGILLTSDKLINIQDIGKVDNDGTVHLTVDSERVNAMDDFIQDQYSIIREDEMRYLPHAWAGGTGGAAPLFWGSGYTGRGYDEGSSMYEPAPVTPPAMKPDENLPSEDVVVSSGTDVIGRDGEKIGTVDELVYDENGQITGLVVKAGMIFSDDVRIPARWIDTISGEAIQLSVTADEAENTEHNA